MKRTLFLLSILLFTSSCATIMNKSHKKISVYTTAPSQIIFGQDTINTINNKARLAPRRQKENIVIEAITDSTKKQIEVVSRNSFMYYFNFYCNLGLGALIDREKAIRYTFPKRVFIDSSDSSSRYFGNSQANNKGELHLHLSLLYINSFLLNPDNKKTKKIWLFLASA